MKIKFWIGTWSLILACGPLLAATLGAESQVPMESSSTPTASISIETPPDVPVTDATPVPNGIKNVPGASPLGSEIAASLSESPGTKQQPIPPNKFYAGIALSYDFLGGGFNGSRPPYITGDGVTLLAPKLDSGMGVDLHGGVIGPNLPEPFGKLTGEVRFKYSVHRWVFEEGQDSSAFYSLGLCARVFFINNLPVKPFAVLGTQYRLLDLKNAAQKPGYVTGGASFGGFALDLGLGVNYDLSRDFAVSARVSFQPAVTSGGSAFNSSLTNAPGLQSGSLQLGMEYRFSDEETPKGSRKKEEIDWGF